MKSILIIAALCVFIILTGTSCKKQVCGNLQNKTSVARTVHFVLYTDKDVSDNGDIISFSLFIENSRHEILWDSAMAPIREKDIPGVEDKIVIQKLVPNDDNSLLKAGFHYSIWNVGYASYHEYSDPGQVLKVVDFNFQLFQAGSCNSNVLFFRQK